MPQSRADAEAAASTVRKVYEPETGRTRLVKGNGEIVEAIISREEQQRIRHRASRMPAAAAASAATQQYTGKTKFPSEHPLFGYGPSS